MKTDTITTAAKRIALSAGLEAWAGLNLDQTPKGIAARYNVDVDTVKRSKAATAELHRQLSTLFGHEYYFEEMNFRHFIDMAMERNKLGIAA